MSPRSFRTFLAAAFLLIPLLSASSAEACRCARQTTGHYLKRASLVFLGTLTKIKKKGKRSHYEHYTFTVQKVWKGKVGRSIQISSATHSCGLNFSRLKGYVGKSLVMFANGTASPTASQCSGIIEANTPEGQKRIKQLGPGKKPPAPPTKRRPKPRKR